MSSIPNKPAIPGSGICGFDSTGALLKMPSTKSFTKVKLRYYTWGITAWEDTPIFIATQDNRNNPACSSVPLCCKWVGRVPGNWGPIVPARTFQ